jgi:nitrogen-specific signal transduction histidine kinase
LGLAIFRKLADMMNGDVSLDSETGKGSTFSLTLPVSFDFGFISEPIATGKQKAALRTNK